MLWLRNKTNTFKSHILIWTLVKYVAIQTESMLVDMVEDILKVTVHYLLHIISSGAVIYVSVHAKSTPAV